MKVNRRSFLKTGGLLTIGFTLGAGSVAGSFQQLPSSLRRNPMLNAWLQVLPNGNLLVFTGKLELGQGIRTAIAQVATEELGLDMDKVEVHLAETGVTPDEGYTAGSGSIENSAMAVRYASAYARERILELAALQWQVNVNELELNSGIIHLKSGSKQMLIQELFKDGPLEEEVKLPVKLKEKAQYKLVGKAIPRTDIQKMVLGEEVYVQDMRLPNMVFARVVRPPGYTSRLTAIDESGIKKAIPGLLKTIVNGNFVGVIAKDEYSAIQAQEFYLQNARWDNPSDIPSYIKLSDYLLGLPSNSGEIKRSGKIISNKNDKKWLRARYTKPYIMHGSIGPSCAIAKYEHNQMMVWTHSQGVYPLRTALSKLLKLPADQIQVKGVPGSGCYGHNGADDVAAEAAVLAMAYPGYPVKLQWSRQEEHSWEPYGSAMILDVAATLTQEGKISEWEYTVWSDAHSTRPGGDPAKLLPAHYLKNGFPKEKTSNVGGGSRNAEPYYSIPHQQITANHFSGPLRVSALRSLGAYGNIFAIESFMDELAEKAGIDPITFRINHSTDSRAIAVLKKLDSLLKSQQVANSGIGMAFSRYKNTGAYCAIAARVSINKEAKEVQINKMWAVIDVGEIINPDGVINQTEGGMIQAASWTLQEEVIMDNRHVSSNNWTNYPIFRFHQVPELEVVLMPVQEQAPLGAGEAAQGPAGAAIVNAVYAASGKRIRELPVHKHLFT